MPSASFYGSPSKHITTPNKEAHTSSSTTVSSFAERMRKNAIAAAAAASVTNSNNNTVNNSGSNSFFVSPDAQHCATQPIILSIFPISLSSSRQWSACAWRRSTRRAINFNQVAVERDMSNEVASIGGSLLFRPQQVSNDLLNLEELLDMQRQRHSPPRHKWFSRPFQHWLNAADAQCKRQRRRSKRADYSYSQLEWYVTSDGRFYVSFCSQFEINHLFLQSCVDIRIEHNYCK